MATRKQQPVEVQHQVPHELYWGIPAGAFGFFGADDPRSDESSDARHRWTQQVRAAGYTATSLREKAETDPAYQRWLEFRERKRRLCATPEATSQRARR